MTVNDLRLLLEDVDGDVEVIDYKDYEYSSVMLFIGKYGNVCLCLE